MHHDNYMVEYTNNWNQCICVGFSWYIRVARKIGNLGILIQLGGDEMKNIPVRKIVITSVLALIFVGCIVYIFFLTGAFPF